MPDILDKSYQGFALGNQEMMEALEKALEAGTGVDTAAFAGGRAMTPESLDTTLVNVLWTQDEARLFKALKKKSVKSPVHQWAKRTDVGGSDGAWVSEGGDSEEADQTIARKYTTMKYLQTLRKATLQATITNMLEDAIASEKMAGTLWLIKQIEKALFEGDSSCIEEEPDGLVKLIESSNIIDLRGNTAESDDFENAITEGCRIIRAKYGIATDMYTSLKVMEDTQRLLRDRTRFPNGEVGAGAAIWDHYPTPFAKPKLVDDIFILEGDVGVASALTAKRPSQPSIAVARAGSGGLTSLWGANDAGNYYYQIAHVNKYGPSQLSAAVQVTGVLADDKVTITVTDGATPGTGVYIFRSKKDAAAGTDCRYIVKTPYSGSDSQEIIDLNNDLPGTSSVFLMNMNAPYDAIEWLQFLPMMKFNLFPTNAAVTPFLMLLFGALALKKQEQHVRIKNIAPSRLGWF